MLIAVDHGNKQIKTVHCSPFVSGLTESTQKPFGKEVLAWQGKFYTLSGQRIPYRRDKTEDDRFFVLTLFAIANELLARNVGAETVLPIQLAIGLPRRTMAHRTGPLWTTFPAGASSNLSTGAGRSRWILTQCAAIRRRIPPLC